MAVEVLEKLRSEEFAVAIGFLSTPRAVHRMLHKRPEIHKVKEALKEGAIVDDTISRFASSLLGDLRRGERFPHELALAALSVSLERRPTSFAEEFLCNLSRLKLAEMSLCIRVARECLLQRVTALAGNKKKDFRSETSDPDLLFSVESEPFVGVASRVGVTKGTHMCEVQ